MRYSFITFRSHPTEKHLDEDFLTMIQPMLKSTPKYIMSYEDENTIDSHFHLLMFHDAQNFDISNLKQKFKTKAFKNWFSQFENYNTIIDPKLDSQCLQVKLVGNTNDDYLTTVGYISKDNVYRSKNFDEQEITDAVKYYWLSTRKQPKMDKTWKIMNVKNAHAITEQFSEQQSIPFNEPSLWFYMAQEKISTINLSLNQRSRLIDELCVAHSSSKSKYEENYHKSMLSDCEDGGYSSIKKDYFDLLDKYNKFHEWVKERSHMMEQDIPDIFEPPTKHKEY